MNMPGERGACIRPPAAPPVLTCSLTRSLMHARKHNSQHIHGTFTTHATRAQQTTTVCLESPYCTNFETWGFTDKYTWLTSVDGQEEYPLPFDATYEPKEAFDSMVQVLKAQQRRDEAK